MNIGVSSIGRRRHRKGQYSMNFSLENRVLYALLALLVLAVFYGIYFIKILTQKQRGIQTRQIGRRKENPFTRSKC